MNNQIVMKVIDTLSRDKSKDVLEFIQEIVSKSFLPPDSDSEFDDEMPIKKQDPENVIHIDMRQP